MLSRHCCEQSHTAIFTMAIHHGNGHQIYGASTRCIARHSLALPIKAPRYAGLASGSHDTDALANSPSSVKHPPRCDNTQKSLHLTTTRVLLVQLRSITRPNTTTTKQTLKVKLAQARCSNRLGVRPHQAAATAMWIQSHSQIQSSLRLPTFSRVGPPTRHCPKLHLRRRLLCI